MNSLLEEQLLKAGFAAPKKADPPPAEPPRQRRPGLPAERRPLRQQPAPPAAPPAASEPSLKDAFAQRERQEQSDRDRAKAAADAESKRRKLQREQLKAVKDAAADIARNFNWARKIRRIYVTAEQLRGLNAGELGVVALDGRFTLHPAETVRAAAAIDPHALGLLVDPAAPEPEPEYSDPRYQVPDDLVW
jgi:uncharacterized protein YaiL (DUF2058 family)